MPLKDRFRRALTLPRSNSSSSISDPAPTPPISTTNGSTTPTPSITLTKTSSRLSKTLTWNTAGRKEKKEEKARKKLEDWERRDEEEWRSPGVKYPGRKSKAHQDMLRAFEWKFREGRPSLENSEGARRRWSGWSSISGVSPGNSRMNSVDGDGGRPRRSTGGGRKWSSGGLSREVSRTEDGAVPAVQSVPEE